MGNLDAIATEGSSAQLCAKGNVAIENKSYDEAISFFNGALKIGKDKEAYLGLGQVYSAQGQLIKAVQNLMEALKIDPKFHQAFGLIGDIYYSQSQGMPAIESYAQAVAIDPTIHEYKQKLIIVAGGLVFKKLNPNLKGVLLECLESKDVELVHFGRAWLSIFSSDPLLAQIYKLSKHNNYAAFKRGMDFLPNCDALIEPFFLTGLGKFIVPNIEFERWCAYLRRYLLDAVSSEKSLFSDPEDIDLITCALSKFSFFTDYILNISEQEEPLIDGLKKKVESSDNPKLSDLAMLACYKNICLLDNAVRISANLVGSDHVSQIPKSQIDDYWEQQEIKKNIPKLTEINDEISATVQEQYEEFPYPRWEVASKYLFNHDIEGHLLGKAAKILIAGCGTGKEAVQLAFIFPDAQITAVDLSRASLAYAIFKARELGIKNIKFMHGDIMELGKLDSESFDYVSSMGVLHHMNDPIAGWKIIHGLLKPDGIMRIALYSRQARWAINEAREIIKKKNIDDNAQSIRNFRKNISTYIKHKYIKSIGNFYDYYALSECHDLLFHVQEHQFDLPDIKVIIDDLGLNFLTFHLSNQEIQKYKKRNPDDINATNLDGWAKWEEKNKDLFMSMYAFWCRKK